MSETQDIKEMREKLEKHEREIAENRHGLSNARQILDIKLTQLTADISELKNALKWAGGLIISLMISFMGWAALQQYNANEAQKADLQKQVELLRTQDQAATERQKIIEQLQGSADMATKRDDASIARDDKSNDTDPR